ncbi:MAG: 50S ribosomal protein L10 [Candidatus Marinimicrobia bacterium]|nr:50S ribosomal protein L10 [Candidatus Neomarinimicrobiota bacterium]|tara:strand:+ start:3462 stop:3980 length:519 start_codon:yes stop_codon:yes gene_type:complete
MPSEKNKISLKELKETIANARAVYFTEYHGLDVGSITKLRREFFKAEIEFKVAKNTLLKIALDDSSIEGVADILHGSTAIAVSYNEPVAPAKVIKDFNKKNDLPKVKGILFDGNLLPGEEFKRLADMPNKDELLGKLVMMLDQPLQKLVSTLVSPLSDVVVVLNNLKEKKSE